MTITPTDPVPLLTRLSLRDQALGVIRSQIATGAIAEGEIHSASALAARLGVSNSPIREAMLTLVNQGVMEAVRNRGYRLIPLTERDRADIYDLRVMLEVPAMRELAGRGHREWSAFEALCDASIQHALADEIDLYLEADRAFHLGLVRLLGNRRLESTIADLRDRTRLVNVRSLAAAGRIGSSAGEHRTLLDAIERGDGDAAATVMQAHLDHIPGDWNAR